jgi:hypothetical protein
MPLKTFRVSGSVIVPVGYSIEVKASSEEDAEVRVRDLLLTSKSYRVRDFDGNNIDFSDGDIEVDEISDK